MLGVYKINIKIKLVITLNGNGPYNLDQIK